MWVYIHKFIACLDKTAFAVGNITLDKKHKIPLVNLLSFRRYPRNDFLRTYPVRRFPVFPPSARSHPYTTYRDGLGIALLGGILFGRSFNCGLFGYHLAPYVDFENGIAAL